MNIDGALLELFLVSEHKDMPDNLKSRMIEAIEKVIEYRRQTQTTEWIDCDKILPDKATKTIVKYDNGKISGAIYLGNRTFDVDYPDDDPLTSVKYWTPDKE